MLEGYVRWHRDSFLVKCVGLTGEQLADRTAPPSTLSLLGLIRHQAGPVRRTGQAWSKRTDERRHAGSEGPDDRN